LNLRLVIRILGILLVFSGLAMLAPLGFSLYFRDGDHWALLESIGVNLGGGGLFYWLGGKASGELRHREGFAIVTLGWVVLALFGCLPFLFSGTLPDPVDAFFETMSGYSTTGASVFTHIEGSPRGILFWRSLTHWFGGMGVLVLAIAILPFLGVGGMQLFRAESPGPVSDRLTPRITSTAKLLWIVYLALTLVETMLLIVGGMSFYEALCHTFGTMATGGFSTRDASIAAYDSLYIESVIVIFMFLAGVNFSLHYGLLARYSLKGFWKDEEFRFYVMVVVLCTALVMVNLMIQAGMEAGPSLRQSAFQVVSIVTTTGFITADFDQWPSFAKVVLLVLMFVGGCAGSTGGAMKHVRVLILIKSGFREIRRLILPGAVIPLRMNGKAVPNEVATNVLGFFLLYMLVFVLATFFVSFLGVEFVTAFSSVAATLGNIGPGFSGVGAVQNYVHLPALVKVLLCGCMLLGRLEIYTVMVLLMPSFWKK